MTPATTASWQEANKRLLQDEFDLLRQRLRAHVLGQGEAEAEPVAPNAGSGTVLEQLCTAFGLSTFERSLLLLCAGAEMDGEIGTLCARANGDPRQSSPTFSLALAVLPEPHWSALVPSAPLRRWRLLRREGEGPLTSAPLRIDERILHGLLGVSYLPPGLEGRLRPLSPLDHLPDELQTPVQSALRALEGAQGSLLLQLQADPRRGGRLAASAVASRLGTVPWLLPAAAAPQGLEERLELARLWERETALVAALLVVELEVSQRPPQPLVDLLDELGTPVLILGEQPLLETARPVLRVAVPRPDPETRLQSWQQHLGPLPASTRERVAELVSRFDLPSEDIAAAASASRSPDPDVLLERLHQTCRAQSRPAFDGLAQRIDGQVAWEDLVLPERPMSLLRQMAAQVHHQFTVHHRWGFARRLQQGLGVSALFVGPSGTGKTLAAQVLATELQLDLYRIDLSAVVSKYIGETERNLRRVFDAAETGGAILLFDEADALFGRRSEVKDSHDRYANIEVGYLLQRMEAYSGLAILTTNLRDNLDTAFLRRLRFSVEFPFPGQPQRQAIWQRVFPSSTPCSDLDASLLAQLQLPGGSIRNIALNAAFLAAAEPASLSMRHLRQAALTEYAKLERTPNPSELSGWPR